MEKRNAQCVCGEVKVETRGDPAAVVVCHCIACQRRTGTAFGVGAYFSPEQVTISGETKSFARPTDSGEKFVSNFCTNCGTSIFWKVEPDDGRIGIALGAFGDPQFPAPIRSVWEESKHTWVNLEGIKDHFKQGRIP